MKNYLALFLIINFTILHNCKKANIPLKNSNKIEDTIISENMKIDESAIKNYYKLHLLNSSVEDEEEDYFITENDINLMIPVLEQGLKDNGFEHLENEEYKIKIEGIFGKIDDNKCFNVFPYAKFTTYVIQNCENMNELECSNNAELMKFLYSENVFFIKGINAISSLPKVEYFTTLNNNKITINIPTNIIYRNLYLLNDDNSKLMWLLQNDKKFMMSLVKDFGYTKDLNILKWAIDNTKFDKNNPQDYGKLFWIKKCDGNLKLHANTFKVLQKLYLPNDPSENRYILDNIQSYIEYFANEEDENGGLTGTERLKTLANLAYFAEQYKYDERYNSNSQIMGRLRYFLGAEDLEILKKNNYFNLPKFKEWWDNADYDEYYVAGEYEGPWGRDNVPMNITEFRKNHPKK